MIPMAPMADKLQSHAFGETQSHNFRKMSDICRRLAVPESTLVARSIKTKHNRDENTMPILEFSNFVFQISLNSLNLNTSIIKNL